MEVKNITSDKPTSSDVARYRANYLSEQEGAYLYTKLAEAESDAHKDPGGSAWGAAITSFFLFAIGAIFPVFPFIFTHGFTAVIISLLAACIIFGLGRLIGSAVG